MRVDQAGTDQVRGEVLRARSLRRGAGEDRLPPREEVLDKVAAVAHNRRMTTSHAIRNLLTAFAFALGIIALGACSDEGDSTDAPPSTTTTTIPEARPATAVPMTDPGPPSPTCTEDEEEVRYSESVAICLHAEGDGWRVIDPS